MEGHNRTYLSLRWVGMDDEQIVWKRGSFDAQSRRGSDSAVRHNQKARESSMPDRLLLLVFSLRIPAGESDFLARPDQ